MERPRPAGHYRSRAPLPVTASTTAARPTHIHLRWRATVQSSLLVPNDAWERSYGDLHWESLVPERVLPWYFLTADRDAQHGYGVKTGAAALCFWQIDPKGISLWLNVSNGGSGVALGNRELLAATIITHRGEPGESPAPFAIKCATVLGQRQRSMAATTGITHTATTPPIRSFAMRS